MINIKKKFINYYQENYKEIDYIVFGEIVFNQERKYKKILFNLIIPFIQAALLKKK